jgi:hypothetical protein
MHLQWGPCVKGTPVISYMKETRGKFKQGENVLVGEPFKGTVALLQLKGQFA